MNKVYKLVWSKVRSAWVVTSEIAKGHGKDSSSGRNRKLLRSGVVMALLGSFFTVGMPSVAALTQEEENSIVNAIMQRLETERKTPHYLSVYVSKDKKGANYNNDAASDLHSIAVGENTQTNSDSIAIGYNATVYNKKTLMDNWWNGVNHPWWKSDTSYYNLQSLREVDDGKFKDEWAVDYLRGRHSVAIGTYSRANDTMTIAIGYKASAGVPGGMNTVAPQVAIGALAEASGVDSIALGAGATSRTYAGVSIGYGAFNYGGYYGIAIGQFSRAEQEGGIAMGWRARVQGEYGLALGNSTRVMGGQGNVALGYGSVADRTIYYPPYLAEDKGVMDTVEGQQGVVSIGNSNTIWNPDDKPEGPKPALSKRQLINLAAGTEDSDAVNVAQLKAVNNKADKLDKRISEEKAHYFSVSGVSRDDRSNYHNNATNGVEKSLAIGEYVVANDYSVAIGYGAKNNFDTEYKNGQTVKRTHYYSMGLLKDRVGSPRFNGEWAYDKIRGSHTVAIGDRASTNDTMGIAIGYKASAGKLGTNNAVAPQIAVGALAEASGSSTIAVGEGATAEMDSSIAIGTGAYAKPTGSEDIHSIAFGTYSRSEATESMAFGHHAKALTNRSIAIGAGSEAKASSGVALGYSSVADRARSLDPYLKGEGKVSDTVYGTLGAVSIGNPYGDRLYDNIRVGWYAEKGTRQLTNLAAGSEDSDAVNVAQLRVIDDKKANLDASNLTKASDKSAWATVLGTGTITQNDANLVTGDTVYQYIKNNVKATKVTVDGKEESQDGNLKIKKTDDNGQLTYDLSLNDEITIGKAGQDGKDGKIGINGKDGRSADITIGKGAAGVDGKDGEAGQAGKDGITRIIYQDEKGETRQVATLDDGLKFKGDNDTVVTRKLNQQLNITGGITNESLVTTGNIGVFGTKDGVLAVKLAKNLTGLSSAEFKDGDKVTNITAQTITQKDGDNITNIKAGDVSVTRKDGDTNKTVNLWELGKTVETNAKATKVTVDGKENNSDDADANLKITNKTVNGQTTYDLSLNNEITLGKAGTPGEGGAPGKDGVDGKIGINGKDGRSADITIGKGAAGV
ncbi:ESPR-type extended signal peptide-containing protein, partial [Negativicoccus succinicivorans]|uniref:ESPR-type extended signal peptide-containing protein n=1 Tax=Negativicoccus succinicivorans TaxID=620903 RepID=UPI00235345EA